MTLRTHGPAWARACALLVALALTLSLALSLAGVPGPAAAQPAAASAAAPDLPRLPCADPPDLAPRVPMKCVLKPTIKGAPTIVVWGDSHAMQMIPGIRRAIAHRRINLVGFIFGACPPMDPRLLTTEQRRNASPCQISGHKAMRYIDNSRRNGRDIRVVVGAAWQLYHHLQAHGEAPFMGYPVTGKETVARQSAVGTPRMFRALARWRVPTDVIGQSPFVPAEPEPCPFGLDPYRCDLPRDVALGNEAFNKRQLRSWMSGLAGRPRLIETSNGFCTARTCHGIVRGINTFADPGHISATMSRTLAPFFSRTVDAVVDAAS